MARERCVDLQQETGCGKRCQLARRVMVEHQDWLAREEKDAAVRAVLEETHRAAYARWGKKVVPGRRRGPTGRWKGTKKKLKVKKGLPFWARP